MNCIGSMKNATWPRSDPARAILLALATLCSAVPSEAAEITARPPEPALLELLPELPDMRAVIDITGEIRLGDAAKLTEMVGALDPASRISGASGVEILVRLESPGGAFVEAIEIARIINKNKLQTFVAAGSECLSACAVIFMAGTYQPGFRQQERSFRKVEWPARLGFHRPFLNVELSMPPELLTEMPSEDVSALINSEFASAFDVANELIQQMIAVDPSNWSPELLVEMLTATETSAAGRFVYLETVGDALTWDIDIANSVPPAPKNRLDDYVENFWLCYNAGRQIPAGTGIWPNRQAAEETLYEALPNCCGRQGAFWDSKMIDVDDLTYYTRVRGWYFGCTINYESRGSTPRITYFHDDSVINIAPFLMRYNPGTPLGHTIGAPAGDDADNDLRSQILSGGREGQCTVYKGAEMLEAKPCRQFPVTSADNGMVEIFVWPSGTQTVVTGANAPLDRPRTVNGNPGSDDDDGRDGHLLCLKNGGTGNTFCFSREIVPH